MIKLHTPTSVKLVAFGLLVAVALAANAAYAEPEYKIIHTGCKLVATPNHPWIASENTVLMAGGEDCND